MRENGIGRVIARYDPTALTVDPLHPDLPAPIDRSEMAWAVAIDAADQVKACVRIAQGGSRHVEVSIPAFLSAILIAHCEWAILVHNHPGRSLTISHQDKELTRQIIEATALCGITLVDHYVISPDGREVSLVAAGIMTPAPITKSIAAS